MERLGAAAGDRGGGLVLTTFNIWFDPYHATQRWTAISAVLAKQPPDVMVFQEVTRDALQLFVDEPWIRDDYCFAAVTSPDVGNYGMLLLSRIPPTAVTYTRLPTRLNRGFLRADFLVGGRPTTLCCVHLESGKAAAGLRARQLRRIVRAVGSAGDVVLLGDFNMRDNENRSIGAPFTDVWPLLRPGEPGFTEDTTINFMRLDAKGKQRHVRFDRVLLKGCGWTAAEIDLLGTEPVSPELPRVFPSDHFGVRCRLVPSSPRPPERPGR